MAKDSKTTGTDSTEEELSFEEAFDRLESVVRDLETEQVPLEELIENYEAGTRWFRTCQQRLEEAQGRIEVIRQKAGEKVELEPFDPESADPVPFESASSEKPAASSAKPSLREDAELF